MPQELPACLTCGIQEGCKIKNAVFKLKGALDQPVVSTGEQSVSFERVYSDNPLFASLTTPILQDKIGTYRSGDVTRYAVQSKNLVLPVDQLNIFGPEEFKRDHLVIPETVNIREVRAGGDNRALIDRGAGKARFYPTLPVGAPQWVDQQGASLICHLGPKSYPGHPNNIIHG